MSSRGPKQTVFACLAEIAQALGHAHRLELLELLGQGECSVEGLAGRTGLSFANTSRHLQILRRARLAEPRREGKRMLYSLAGHAQIVPLLQALGRVGERNAAEIERVMASYFRVRDSMTPVSRGDLLALMQEGLVTVLDLRPEDEFALGHVLGARNVQLAALERYLTDLPPNQEIVAYCRGPYCVLSFEAVATLRSRDFRVRRLEDGFPEWKAAGLPVGLVPAAASLPS